MSKLLLTLFVTMLFSGAAGLAAPTLAQRVVDPSPELNSQVASPDSISAQFDAPVDPASVRIFVNDQDVTSRSTITRSFFSYRPDRAFAPGTVRVRVDYRGSGGDARNATWNFTVAAAPTAQIVSVTHNATASLNTGSTLIVSFNGTSGAQASVLLVEGGTVRELPAREITSGAYEARLTLSNRDRVLDGVAIARLRLNNQSTYAAASAPVILNAPVTAPTPTPTPIPTPTPTPTPTTPDTSTLQPTFTSHRNGDRVSAGFTLVGQTRPNARVRVSVTGRVSVLGINLGQTSTLVDREVTADSSGRFQIDVPAPRLPVPTQYTVRATARSGNETSRETTLTLSSQ